MCPIGGACQFPALWHFAEGLFLFFTEKAGFLKITWY
jgi:hypothetical protein